YFNSEEGGAHLDQGPEGDLWEWNEDETKRVDKEDGDSPDQYDDREDYLASITHTFGIPAPYLVHDIEKEETSDSDVFTEAQTGKEERSETYGLTGAEKKEKMEPYGQVTIPKV